MNVKLTKVNVYYTGKDGAPLTGQWGAYVRVTIQTTSHQNQWLSASVKPDSPVTNWKAGESHDIDVVQKGQYLNFTVPKSQPAQGSGQAVEKLFVKLNAMDQKLEDIKVMIGNLELVDPQESEAEPTPDEQGVENLPF